MAKEVDEAKKFGVAEGIGVADGLDVAEWNVAAKRRYMAETVRGRERSARPRSTAPRALAG